MNQVQMRQECRRKAASGRRVGGAIRSLFSARGLHLILVGSCMRLLLVPVLMYGNEKVRARIRAVQMDKIRGLLDIRRMDSPECMDDRIEEGVLSWLCHVERMENDNIAKGVYVGEFAGSRSAGQPRKE